MLIFIIVREPQLVNQFFYHRRCTVLTNCSTNCATTSGQAHLYLSGAQNQRPSPELLLAVARIQEARGQQDHRPPRRIHRLENVCADRLARSPVSVMNAATERAPEAVLWVLQLVHDLRREGHIGLGVADEDVVLLVIARISVRQKEVAQNALVVEPHLKEVIVNIRYSRLLLVTVNSSLGRLQ